MSMINIVMFGLPGSGKGTQSVFLVKNYSLVHISTGDIFRKNIKNKTLLGKKVKEIMDRGELVSDKMTTDILSKEIEKYPNTKGFIFDGFPRTIKQAQTLDNLLKERNTSVLLTLSLEVSEEELKQRLLLRGEKSDRNDDKSIEIISNRIKEYNNKTEPLKKYYKNQNKLYSIDGIGSEKEVSKRNFLIIDKFI